MGASTFRTVGDGKTAKDAFDSLVASARYAYGNEGYTGSIAEKSDFVMITKTPMTIDAAVALGDKLINDEDSRVDDKYGPAGCIPLEDDRWMFFGWAAE